MLAILTSKIGLAGIALALVLGVFGIQAVRLSHAKSEITAMKAQEKAAEAAEKVREANAAAISQTASAGIVAAQEKTRTVTRTLVQKVKVYVPQAADARCVVPDGFVSLWNAAIGGADLPAPSDPSGAKLPAPH